jgi:hypothetical protein
MANMQAKSNAQDSQAKQGVQGFVPELNQEDFRNKWGYGGNPYMGYGDPYMGYGYPYHHHGHFGYGFPYYHHHHFPYGYYHHHGMFGPYGGMNYPQTYTRGYDPVFTGEFAQYPFQYPGYVNNPYNSAVEQQPVANNVIQGTATPVRKQRSNGSSEFRSQKTSDEKTE